jgi:hypothetical protein
LHAKLHFDHSCTPQLSTQSKNLTPPNWQAWALSVRWHHMSLVKGPPWEVRDERKCRGDIKVLVIASRNFSKASPATPFAPLWL